MNEETNQLLRALLHMTAAARLEVMAANRHETPLVRTTARDLSRSEANLAWEIAGEQVSYQKHPL